MSNYSINQIKTYDVLIQKYFVDRRLPYDWRIMKAQLYQESLLEKDARSNAGALGLAQFMPATWLEVKRDLKLPDNASPFHPESAIHGACYYMMELYCKWTAERLQIDRYCLALASYNAGMGNIVKAQQLAKSNQYNLIMAKLHHVTGDTNALQTRNYVQRILGFYNKLITEV